MTIIRRCRTRGLPTPLRGFLFTLALRLRLLLLARPVAFPSHPTYIPPAILDRVGAP